MFRALTAYLEARAMSQIASQIADALILLARAQCAVAVERHAKDVKHHEELASDMWGEVMRDFHEGDVTSATRLMIAKALRIDPKTLPE